MFMIPSLGRDADQADMHCHRGQLNLLRRVLCGLLWLSAMMPGDALADSIYTIKESRAASSRVALDDAGNLTVTGAVATGLGTISRPPVGQHSVLYKLNTSKILMRIDCVSSTSAGMAGNLYLTGNLVSSSSLVKQSRDQWRVYGYSGLVAKLDDAGNFYLKGQLTAPACTLIAVARSSRRIDLDWRGGMTNLSGYHVYRSVNGGSLALLTTLGTAQTRYVDKTAAPGNTYQYCVTPFYVGGEATASSLVSVTTPSAAYYYETWDAVSAPHWPGALYGAPQNGQVAGSDNVWNWDTLTTSVTKCSFRNSWNGWEAGRFLAGTDSGDFLLKGATTWFSFNTTNSLRTGFEAKLDAVDDQADRAISFEIRNETSYLGGGSVRICLDGQSSHKALTIQAMDRGTRSNELKTTLSLSAANEYWITAQFQPDSNGLRAAYAVYSKDALNTPLASGEGLLDQIPLVVLDQTSVSFPRRAVGSVDDIELAGVSNALGTQTWVQPIPQTSQSQSGGGDTPPSEGDEGGTPVTPTAAHDYEFTEGTVTSGVDVYPAQHIPALTANSMAGYSISAVGDFNGDGHEDFVVGAPFAKWNRNDATIWDSYAGEVYLVFGPTSAASSGFVLKPKARVSPQSPPIFATGMSVAGAGDLNQDGYADVLIGAPWAVGDHVEGINHTGSGEVYLIYGSADFSGTLAEADNAKGVIIQGANAGDNLGQSVAGIMDFNGDAYPDIVLAAPSADANGLIDAGKIYVISGKYIAANRPAVIDLNGENLSEAVLVMAGAAKGDHAGAALAGVGDVNGDGLPDLLIGAPDANVTVGSELCRQAGAAYLVYGGAFSKFGYSTLNLGQMGEAGTTFKGAAAHERLGQSVAGAGDVNGDGLFDLLIGAPYEPQMATATGKAYLVFGDTVAPDTDLANAITYTGANAGDWTGATVQAAGDVNGDGYADFMIAAPRAASGPTTPDAGAVYLLSGSDALVGGDVANQATATFAGSSANGAMGRALSYGDIFANTNIIEDGLSDLLMTLPGAYPWSQTQPGNGNATLIHPYLGTIPESATYHQWMAMGVTGWLPMGGLSADNWASSRASVKCLNGLGSGNAGASSLAVTLIRNRNLITNLDAVAHVARSCWRIQSTRISSQLGLRVHLLASDLAGLNTSNLHAYVATSLNGPWSLVTCQTRTNGELEATLQGLGPDFYFVLADPAVTLTAAYEAGSGIQLNWSNLTGSSSNVTYTVYCSTNGGSFSAILTDTTNTSYLDTAITVGAGYRYYVVFDNQVESRISNTVSLTCYPTLTTDIYLCTP